MTPEDNARQQIDAQLVACGWVVQDYRQFNPSVGRGFALREAPLKANQLFGNTLSALLEELNSILAA
jgi:hypothetical protein